MPKTLELVCGLDPKPFKFGPVTPEEFGRVPGKLSSVGHTMDMYRRLPHGWRTTPKGKLTDRYMWRQFLQHPECRAKAIFEPTILYMKRGGHPGWSVKKRLAELKAMSKYLDEHGADRLREVAMEGVFRRLSSQRKK